MSEDIRVEVLSEDECTRLLQGQSLGRIAIVVDGRPQIFPVNYAFQEGVVVFRTSAGWKLEHAPLTYVAFEIDHLDPKGREGWSVMVHGHAREITGAIDPLSERLRRVDISPAPPGTRNEWLAVYADEITGRRFSLTPR